MPVLTIKGVPDAQADVAERMLEPLRDAVASLLELRIEKAQVSVFFPPDLVQQGLGEEIIVFVDGLLDKPERTPQVRRALAALIRDKIAEYFTEANLIEVFIFPFCEDNGFSHMNRL